MNNDKAYLMGLIVGGGSANSAFDRFDIKLPIANGVALCKILSVRVK